MKKLLTALTLSALASTVLADTQYHSGKVKQIWTSADREGVVFSLDNMKNPNGCIRDDYYVITPEHDLDHALSVLMTAKSLNSQVGVHIYKAECAEHPNSTSFSIKGDGSKEHQTLPSVSRIGIL